jgi:hypothetical protein
MPENAIRALAVLGTGKLDPAKFPTTVAALRQWASRAVTEWRAWAQGKTMPSGDRIYSRTNKYVKSIKAKRSDAKGEIAFTAYSDSPIHEYLSGGTPEHDMKKMLRTSSKVRIGKKGRYLIIPFEHQTTGATRDVSPGTFRVPKRLAARLRAGGSSRVMSRFRERVVQTGSNRQFVKRYQTRWGARLPSQQVGKDPQTGRSIMLGQRSKVGSKYTWKSGIFDGMVHVASRAGGSYMTFRTMSEASPASSWIHPGVKPKRIIAQLKQFVLAAGYEADITRAVRQDLIDSFG